MTSVFRVLGVDLNPKKNVVVRILFSVDMMPRIQSCDNSAKSFLGFCP